MESRKQAASRPRPPFPKRGIRLYFTYIVQVDPQFIACLTELLVKTEIVHAIHQRAPHQKLQGKVVNALGVIDVIAAHGFHPAVDQAVAHHIGRGKESVAIGGGNGVFAHRIGQAVGKRLFD